jgi:O-antigen/teichoic acid export membrane protein
MRTRRIFRNTFFSAAGHGVGDALGLLFLIIFARYFGSDVLGDFWYAMATGSILGAFVSHGTTRIILRDAAQNPGDAARFIGAAASFQLLVAAVLLVLLVIISDTITNTERARSVLIIIGVYQVIYVLASIFRTYFSATEKMQYNALLETGHKILILVCGIVALLIFGKPAIVLLVYPLAALAMYVSGYLLVTYHFERPPLRLDWPLSRKWAIAAFPIFAYGMLTLLANRSGVIALGRTADATAVGIYAAGDRLVSAAGLPYVMFTGAVFPIMSKLAHSPQELGRFLFTCLRFTAVASVPVAALVILFDDQIVAFVFGEGFRESGMILAILVLSLICVAINSLLSMLFIATNRLWLLFRIYAVSLAVLFVGIFLTVEAYGPVGLAWSVVASRVTASVGLLMSTSQAGVDVSVAKSVSGPVVSGIVMGVVYSVTPSMAEPLRIIAILAAGAAALILFRGIVPSDIKRLRDAVGR